MANHYRNPRCLVEKNVPVAFILPSRESRERDITKVVYAMENINVNRIGNHSIIPFRVNFNMYKNNVKPFSACIYAHIYVKPRSPQGMLSRLWQVFQCRNIVPLLGTYICTYPFISNRDLRTACEVGLSKEVSMSCHLKYLGTLERPTI